MNVRERLTMRFIDRVITSPEGRAHVLNQAADAEGNGENGFFDHILAHVDDPSLTKMITKHRDDELRHEQMFLAARARTGIDPGPVPQHLKLIDRLDAAVGHFFSHPIRDRRDVMEAYLMLQVIEERAITQFALFELAFRPVDGETAGRDPRDCRRRSAAPEVLPRDRAPLCARRGHAALDAARASTVGGALLRRERARQHGVVVRPRLGFGEPRREVVLAGRERAFVPYGPAAHRVCIFGGSVKWNVRRWCLRRS